MSFLVAAAVTNGVLAVTDSGLSEIGALAQCLGAFPRSRAASSVDLDQRWRWRRHIADLGGADAVCAAADLRGTRRPGCGRVTLDAALCVA